MRGAVLYGPRDVRFEEREFPKIVEPTDASPWRNLAVFYKDFNYSSGLVELGKIDSGIEALKRPGPLKVTIERIESQPPSEE